MEQEGDLGNRHFLTVIMALYLEELTRMPRRRKWTRLSLRLQDKVVDFYSFLMFGLRLSDPFGFRVYLRMNAETFELLLGKVAPRITRQDTNMRRCISAEKRLVVTLVFLAHGGSFRYLHGIFVIAENTIGRIVSEVCCAIYDTVDEYIKLPTTPQEWQRVARGFWDKWNFPNCLGAIDGKHIGFNAMRENGALFFKYKHFHSIVLMAVADASYRFLYVDAGANGRTNDGGVYARCQLHTAVRAGCLGFPDPVPLPGTEISQRYAFIGDAAFPLSTHLMRPYPSKNWTYEMRIFNYRLSRARRVIENAFGILASRWRVMWTRPWVPHIVVRRYTLACCALHNFLSVEMPGHYLADRRTWAGFFPAWPEATRELCSYHIGAAAKCRCR